MTIIIGAGMAGLLAAGILRTEASHIIEGQPGLPNNHSAVLRFRTSAVGDALNIPFKKVQVMKAVEGRMNPVAAALSYSLKTNGTARLRSSITAGSGELVERYIAPHNFISQMAERVMAKVEFGQKLSKSMLTDHSFKGWPLISTIPMPALMKMLEWSGETPKFGSVPGYNINVRFPGILDAYATLYVPDRVREENRISITGDRLTIEVALPREGFANVQQRVKDLTEFNRDLMINDALKMLGLHDLIEKWDRSSIEVKPATYAKILPIDESIRRNFIVWASQVHNIYSLGRFATWRPGLLLDDVVKDVRVIQKLATGSSGYEQHLKGTAE
jgi:hypothetical protein